MNQETKELEKAITATIAWAGANQHLLKKPLSYYILQACKEAGLRFVDMPLGYTDEGIKEIEL